MRDAWRSLRSTPTSTAFVLAVLTLGIAAATVTFSVVDAIVLRPLPFPHPDRLVVVVVRSEQIASSGRETMTLPVFLFEQIRRSAIDSFTAVAAVRRGSERLTTDGEPEVVLAAAATSELFDVLGVRPILGTTFGAANEAPGNDQVAVIGHGLWQRHFGGDPTVVGKPMALESRTVTVLGVMPPGFSYPLSEDRRPEIWTPFVAPADERSGEQLSYYLHVVGRLAPTATRETAEARANALLGSISLSGPSRLDEDLRFSARPLADTLFGDVRGWMLLLLAGVVLVMLVACANVANMQLARATHRARELAVRASIGASRRHLVSSLLAESLILSLAAAALGLLAASWGIGATRAALPVEIARTSDIALDLRVFFATIGAAIATGLAFGAVPAWQATRHDLIFLLRDGMAGSSPGRAPWRSGFLIAEVAFVAVLLVATTLFVTSFVKVTQADIGFDRHNLILGSASGLTTPVAEIIGELERVPGVIRVGAFANGSAPLTIAGGLGGGQSGTRIWRPSTPAESAVFPLFLRVAPGYFAAAGIPILRGRDFTHAELGKPDLVVLDLPTARRLFENDDPVGATVLYGADEAASVVGVVAGVQDRGPEAPVSPHIYLPTRNGRGHEFVMRVGGEVGPAIAGVTAAFDRLRPAGSPRPRVRVLDDAFRSITAERRFAAGLMSLFGAMAMVIAAAGIFGVMASIVAQRRREFGIRVALGASDRVIIGGVLGWASRHLLAGLAIGLSAALLLARGFASFFFGVSPGDAWIYLIVVVIALTVGLAAAVVPARRASRVDPQALLRTD